MAKERSEDATGAEEPPGDSAGVYYISIEDFEARKPAAPKDEEPEAKRG